MAEEDELQALNHALTVCGATQAAMNGLRTNQGLTSLEALMMLGENDVRDMITSINRSGRAEQKIGAFVAKGIQALNYWCKQQESQGLALDAQEFNKDVMMKAIRHMNIMKQQGETISLPLPQGEFKPHQWVSWHDRVMNYFDGQKGQSGIPLSYVVRRQTPPQGL
jgi:hypothetical protein